MKLNRVTRNRGWTTLPNEIHQDPTLSFRARGVLAYLLHLPDGWETDSERISRAGKEGRDAVRSALTELERHRYLFRLKIQGEGGRWRTEYYLHEVPLPQGVEPGPHGAVPLYEDEPEP